MRPRPIPVFEYTLTLEDGTQRTVEAMQYGPDGEWLIFDDPYGSVLSIRRANVVEISRGGKVREEEVPTL